jgi:hypothetical protein
MMMKTVLILAITLLGGCAAPVRTCAADLHEGARCAAPRESSGNPPKA